MPVRTSRHLVTLLTAALTALLLIPAPSYAADAPATMRGTKKTDNLHCSAPEQRAFDFWIGSWDVLNRNRHPDGVRFHETGRATNRVYAVVGGCAIVEHWRGRAISRFIVGFSVRTWDPASRQWRLVLLWPTTGKPSFGELHGEFRHGRGEFSLEREGPTGDPVINRFTFSDITTNSLRWENATSRDGGRSWAGSWIMQFTRRDPVAEGVLWNGPSMTTRRCPGEEHRRFDSLLGEWSGERTDAEGRASPVTVELVRILEGCAVMERVRSREGKWEAFRVRAYEPDPGRWVEYGLNSERRILVRREAEPGDDLVFRDVEPGDGDLTRTRWEFDGEESPRWIVETANMPEGDWTPRSSVSLGEAVGDPFRP